MATVDVVFPIVEVLLDAAVNIYKQWATGSEEDKAAAEQAAVAAVAAMMDARNQTAAAHAKRLAELDAGFDKSDVPK